MQNNKLTNNKLNKKSIIPISDSSINVNEYNNHTEWESLVSGTAFMNDLIGIWLQMDGTRK